MVERIEKGEKRRSPCGERGLKSLPRAPAHATRPSLPVRGAWVEMQTR